MSSGRRRMDQILRENYQANTSTGKMAHFFDCLNGLD